MFRLGDQIGPYTLINKLGRGAFGTVWLSERRTTIATTTAALKIPHDDDVDLETIKQEANLWVRASGHPNVLPIIEANVYDDQVVIASEYAPDGSLESWLRQHDGKVPSVEVAVEIISGVLAGLEHLHARNIIHRDVKPANILFQGKTPRLADFGISRVLKTTSQSSVVAGTPAYMAPEAFDGKRNEQTDIWSVGVISYQLLAGRLPFPQADITSLVGAILSRDPDPLPVPTPSFLREVIARALAKVPKQRYQSAAEMRAALGNSTETTIRHTSPIVVTPPALSTNTMPQSKSSRRGLRFFVITGIAILGLLASSYLYFFGGQTNSPKGEANQNLISTTTPPPSSPQPSPSLTQTTEEAVITLPTPSPLPSIAESSSASPEILSAIPNATPTPTPTSSGQNTKSKIESQFFTFDLKQCRLSGSSVACDLLITNNDRDRRLTIRDSSTIFDQEGNQYRAGKMQLANNEDGYAVRSYMVSGIITKARVTFDAVSPTATKLTLLHLNFSVEDSPDFNIQYRNVPLK